MASRLRAYLGVSLDGRIAGPGGEIDWLERERPRRAETPIPKAGGSYIDYETFTGEIGALLMGRGTFDVVAQFETWFYDELPVVVATSRPLPADVPETVTSGSGSLPELVALAAERAGGKDIYIDGGRLVSAALDEGLLDELTMTVLPTVHGPGIGLFEGVRGEHDLDLTNLATTDSGVVQMTWSTKRDR